MIFVTVAESVLVANMECVLAGFIGKVSDGFAVGRPGGIAVGKGGAVGEIADVAFVGGDSEDVAMGFKHSALAGGRDSGIIDVLILDFVEMRADFGKIGSNGDGNTVRFAAGKIEEMDGAELFEDNGVGIGGGGFKIETFVLDDLSD